MKIWLLLFPLILLTLQANSYQDPYSVLGLSRGATKSEIQKKYRKLAKQFHPDVNKDAGAEEKFTEIASAYEQLTKPEAAQTQQRQQQHRGGAQQEFYFNGKKFTFSGGSGGFHGFNNQRRENKDSPTLTVKRFEQIVLPDSYSTIHLVKVTSRWCFLCMEYDQAWPGLMDHFKLYGMKFWEFPYDSSNLRAKISVYEIPSFLVIISGRVYHFTKPLTIDNLKIFIVAKIQANLLLSVVDDKGVDAFVEDFSDNKVKLIFVSEQIMFPQAMAAFKYKNYYKYGFSFSNSPLSKNIRQIISTGVIIFKELYPAVSAKESAVSFPRLDKILLTEKLLILPKVNSPEYFENVCQINNQYCIIFILTTSAEYKVLKDSAHSGELQFQSNQQYSFLYRDAQSDFLQSLGSLTAEQNVVVMKRVSVKQAEVHFMYWDITKPTELRRAIKTALTTAPPNTVTLAPVTNENAPGILDTILEFFHHCSEGLISQIHVISLNTWLSLMIIVGIFFISYMISGAAEEDIAPRAHNTEQRQEEQRFHSEPEVSLVELTTETVPSLLPLRKSQITLLIVGDLTKGKDVPLPVRVVSAQLKLLSRNSNFPLAYVSHIDHEAWLLQFAKVSECRLIQGSVIAINRTKEYFYFFTPINTEANSSLANLQDRISLWFERLCEGSLPKHDLVGVDIVNFGNLVTRLASKKDK